MKALGLYKCLLELLCLSSFMFLTCKFFTKKSNFYKSKWWLRYPGFSMNIINSEHYYVLKGSPSIPFKTHTGEPVTHT